MVIDAVLAVVFIALFWFGSLLLIGSLEDNESEG